MRKDKVGATRRWTVDHEGQGAWSPPAWDEPISDDPPAFLRERWGSGLTDPTPGIVIGRRPFNPATYARAMEPGRDPYTAAERIAIQQEPPL